MEPVINNTDVPLIWTTKGNVPVDSLTYEGKWQMSEEAVVFAQEYRDATGELVKRSVHVYSRRGLPIGADQTAI